MLGKHTPKRETETAREAKPLTSFVLIKMENDIEENIKKIRRIEGVKETYPLTGEYNAIAKVEVEPEEYIENVVKKINAIESVKGTLTLNVQAPLEVLYRDLETRIKKMIGETGAVNPKYGGYEICVLNEVMFPWAAVFKVLLESYLEVWLSKKDGSIVITCKPPSV